MLNMENSSPEKDSDGRFKLGEEVTTKNGTILKYTGMKDELYEFKIVENASKMSTEDTGDNISFSEEELSGPDFKKDTEDQN